MRRGAGSAARRRTHQHRRPVLPRADQIWAVGVVVIMPKTKGKISRITFRAAERISLSEENWETIEKAYGQTISQSVRAEIVSVTIRFLQLAAAEDTPVMKDALKRITRLRDRAQSFNDVINERPIDDDIRAYVNDQLADTYGLLNYDQAALPTRNYVGRLSLELARFVNVCNEELRFLPQYDYWPDGGAWETWVRHLTSIFANHNLPTGVRKDVDKRPEDIPSAFVNFVWSLQHFLPKQHVRVHSTGALATAIHEARNESKPPVALRKPRGRKTGANTNKRQR
jgi:hypothetical protein